MFLTVLAVFCLIVCERVDSLSVINLDDYSSYHHLHNHKYATIRNQYAPPKTRKAFIDSTFYPQLASSTIEDLLNKEKDVVSGREDNLINTSYDYGVGNKPQSQLQSSANDDLEKIEIHTNNHQSMNGDFHRQHYNIYQTGPSNSIKHSYNRHPTTANAFANNINLNYIHNLLSNKPLATNAFASLLNFNLNSLASYDGFSSSSSDISSNTNSNNKYMTPYYSTPAPSVQLAASNQPVMPAEPHSPSPLPVTTTANPPDQQQIRLSPLDYSGAYGSCGRQQISVREPRIVGGNSTYEGEFPWAVNIQKQGNHHCGGVIVGRRWILTAAHCVRSQLVSNLVVRTGGHSLTRSINHISSHLSHDYLVDQIIMHDDFSRYDNLTASQIKLSANTNNADIALLRLKNDIMWNELAWPVCFPHRDSGNFSGHDAVVVGWGKLSEKSEDFSNELQKVKLTIIDNNVCQSWFRQAGRDIPIDDRIICAGFKKGGKDACHGDSGGPLLSKINGQYVVVGVVSTGIGCARPLLPGLYSRVTSYISWIEKHVT